MALGTDFYNEICEKEKKWENMLISNLLNVYYLPELKNFYLEKLNIINAEYSINKNEISKSIILSIEKIISKLDYLINETESGNVVNIYSLLDLFVFNKTYKSMLFPNNKNEHVAKKNIYELREIKIKEQDIEDDFYYEDREVV